MSGLCAILRGPGEVASPADIDRMLALVEHRARDGKARFALGRFAAGYARTRTRAKLEEPFTDAEGRFCVLDGWIASRGELADGLGLDRGASDPQLILALLTRHGIAGLARLRGELAFVAWDPVADRLVAARDTMGVKPLFHTEVRGELRIASEPAALVLPDDPKRSLNLREIAMAMVEEVGSPASTWLEGVSAVVPGHALLIEGGRTRLEPVRPLAASARSDVDPDDADHALERALRASVLDSLPPDAPACVFVSGGLDSTTIAALALDEAKRHGLPTPLLVTWRYPGMSCDEGEYTASLARHLGVDIVGVDVPLDATAYEPDGPRDFLHEASHAAMVRSAPRLAQDDVRVMLSGIGADELFISTGFEVEAALGDRRWVRAAAFAGLTGLPRTLRPLRRLAAGVARTAVPAGVHERVWGRRWIERQGVPAWLTPWGAALVHEGRAVRRDFLSAWRSGSIAQEHVCAELVAGWQGPHLLEQLDISSHAVGATARLPYFDARVVELFLGLPPARRYDPRWQKVLLRKVAARHLPEEIAWRRSKTLFGDFYRFATYAIEPIVRGLFTESRLESLGIARPGSLLTLLEAARSVEGFQATGRQLTGAVAAEIWLRRWAPHCAPAQGGRM
jgi:asparagine synthase (glutamine-hydrolysing)